MSNLLVLTDRIKRLKCTILFLRQDNESLKSEIKNLKTDIKTALMELNKPDISINKIDKKTKKIVPRFKNNVKLDIFCLDCASLKDCENPMNKNCKYRKDTKNADK